MLASVDTLTDDTQYTKSLLQVRTAMKEAVGRIRNTMQAVLTAHGVPESFARTQADLLLEAQIRGYASHSLLRLPRIVERIDNGVTSPSSSGAHHWIGESFLRVDGQRGLGPVVAVSALDALKERARRTGIAIAGISNSNHIGMLAWYGDYIAQEGLILIGATTSEALVHPWHGKRALIGTNPLCIAVPASPEPLVLDMATSLVSMGKIHDHANRGEPIPRGWALDAQGRPTTDAAAAKAGAIAPFGGAKGYGTRARTRAAGHEHRRFGHRHRCRRHTRLRPDLQQGRCIHRHLPAAERVPRRDDSRLPR